MKAVLVYWVIGCVLAGATAGGFEKNCPNEPKTPFRSLLVMAAAYPMVFGYWLTGEAREFRCDEKGRPW